MLSDENKLMLYMN